ncbi:MAG: hypothetical protein JST87_01570 [Bacteroidetes bacterium]|nr:hypothetical protein [Bacteroidota bacterium]
MINFSTKKYFDETNDILIEFSENNYVFKAKSTPPLGGSFKPSIINGKIFIEMEVNGAKFEIVDIQFDTDNKISSFSLKNSNGDVPYNFSLISGE